MKRSKFSEEQIAYALGQAKSGTPVRDECRKIGVSEATSYQCKEVRASIPPRKRVHRQRRAAATRSREGVTLDTDRVTYGPQPVSFSSDSRLLASVSKGTTLTLWTTELWKVQRAWTLPGTVAPQGQKLAIAGDGEAAIWDASTGQKLIALTSHGSRQATQVAWSPDGNRIVTSSDDGILRFWSAASGNLLASLYTLASSPDWLLVAADGRIDGTERALSTLVAWRVGDRVVFNKELTDRRRVRRLWRLLPK